MFKIQKCMLKIRKVNIIGVEYEFEMGNGEWVRSPERESFALTVYYEMEGWQTICHSHNSKTGHIQIPISMNATKSSERLRLIATDVSPSMMNCDGFMIGGSIFQQTICVALRSLHDGGDTRYSSAR